MRKKFIVGGILALAIVAAVLLLLKQPGGGSDDDDDEGGGGNAATVVTVQTATLARRTLHGYVEGVGSVTGAPAEQGRPPASAKVASAVAGVLARTYVAEGDSVRQGQRLFDLDDRVAQAAVERDRQLDRYAQEAARRQRDLFRSQNTSLKALQDAEGQAASAAADLATAEAELAWTHISAPLSGTVTRIYVQPGEAVDTSAPLADITDLDRLVVAAEVPADLAGQVKSGQRMEVLTQPAVAATMDFVSPAVDPATGAVAVRAALPAGSGLRPGQTVRFRITVAEHRDVLAVPAESVVTDEQGHSSIWVVSGDQAARQAVTAGLRDGGWVEVQAPGLAAGEKVVTVGAYGLPDKTQIRTSP